MTLYSIDARLVTLLNEHFDIEDGVVGRSCVPIADACSVLVVGIL